MDAPPSQRQATYHRQNREKVKPRIQFEWQSGYSAFSVSESKSEKVRAYISNQEVHHRKRTFEEEYIAMLERHKITYDLRYVFEQELIQ